METLLVDLQAAELLALRSGSLRLGCQEIKLRRWHLHDVAVPFLS